MKKLLTTLSHAGVIGLALVIGTIVWLLERARGPGKCQPVLEGPGANDAEALGGGPAEGPQPTEAWESSAASSD